MFEIINNNLVTDISQKTVADLKIYSFNALSKRVVEKSAAFLVVGVLMSSRGKSRRGVWSGITPFSIKRKRL